MANKVVTSPANPLIKRIAKLRASRKQRELDQSFVLSGHALATEAVASRASPLVVRTALIAPGFSLPEGVHLTSEAITVSPNALSKAAGVDRVLGDLGCLLEIPLPTLVSSGSELAKPGHHSVVLCGVSDPGNCGTLQRSASALGWSGCIASSGCADIFADKTLRASRGAPLKLQQLGARIDAADVLQQARSAGAHVMVANESLHDALSVNDTANMVKSTEAATNSKGVVLALGSEGEGVPDDALKHASQTVAIRTPNGDGSPLNVSAAGAILMYALAP